MARGQVNMHLSAYQRNQHTNIPNAAGERLSVAPTGSSWRRMRLRLASTEQDTGRYIRRYQRREDQTQQAVATAVAVAASAIATTCSI